MNLLLIVVVGFLALCGFVGYRKGFIMAAFSMIALLLTFLITINTYSIASKLMIKSGANEPIKEHVAKIVDSIIDSNGNGKQTTVNQETDIIEQLPLPKKIKEAIVENNNTEIYKALNVTKFEDYLTNYISTIITNAIGFIMVFVLASLAIWLGVRFFDVLSKLPIINGVNKTAGLILGLCQGLIGIWIFCIILTAFGSTNWSQNIFAMINESEILSFIYNNNYLMNVIVNMGKVLF